MLQFSLSLPLSEPLAAMLRNQFSDYFDPHFSLKYGTSIPDHEIASKKVLLEGLSSNSINLKGFPDSSVINTVLFHLSQMNESDTIDSFVEDVFHFGTQIDKDLVSKQQADKTGIFEREVSAIASVADHYWRVLSVDKQYCSA